MSKRLIVNPITGKLDQVEDISQIESDLSTAIQPGDNISELNNDEAFQTASEVNTQINNAVAGLVDSSPAALDTLAELANALGDDPNFATTVNNNIAGKANLIHTHTHNDITDFDTEVEALIGSTIRNKNIRNVFEEGTPNLNILATDEILNLRGETLILPDPSLHLGRELIIIDESSTGAVPTGTGVQLLNQGSFTLSGDYSVLKIVASSVSFGGSPVDRWVPTTGPTNTSVTVVMNASNTVTTQLNPSDTEINLINSLSTASSFRVFNITPSFSNLYPGKELVVTVDSTVSTSAGTIQVNFQGTTLTRNGSNTAVPGQTKYRFKYIDGNWKLLTNRYRYKSLSTTITLSTTTVGTLTSMNFNNLRQNTTYRLTMHNTVTGIANDEDGRINAILNQDGTTETLIRNGLSTNSQDSADAIDFRSGSSRVFTTGNASSISITYDAIVAGTVNFIGDSQVPDDTYAILEELNNTVEDTGLGS